MLLVLIRIASGDDSIGYQQHMFLWRTDENYPSIIIKYPPYLFFWTHISSSLWGDERTILVYQTLGSLVKFDLSIFRPPVI